MASSLRMDSCPEEARSVYDKWCLLVDVSVFNKPTFIVCQWADCKVIKADLIKEKHEWLTHHIVSMSFCALAAGLALIYSKGGDIEAE